MDSKQKTLDMLRNGKDDAREMKNKKHKYTPSQSSLMIWLWNGVGANKHRRVVSRHLAHQCHSTHAMKESQYGVLNVLDAVISVVCD